MRKLSVCRIVGLLFIACLNLACDNEVHIHASGTAVPIVYCLLDLDQTRQYVRIGRTFQSEFGADLSALADDSLNIDQEHLVYVELWEEGRCTETYPFQPTGRFERDSSFFPVQALDIYEAEFSVRPNSRYVLYVWFPEDDRVVSGETITIGRPVIEDPKPLPTREITFIPERSYTMRWVTALNSGINQARFTVNYLEHSRLGAELRSFFLYMPVFYVVDTDVWVAQTISPYHFFNGLLANIPVNDSLTRELLPLDYTLATAGEELAFFIKAQQPTFWMNLNQYTNLDNAFGVFSSMTESRINNLVVSRVTSHFLATDTLTRSLNFIDPDHGSE